MAQQYQITSFFTSSASPPESSSTSVDVSGSDNQALDESEAAQPGSDNQALDESEAAQPLEQPDELPLKRPRLAVDHRRRSGFDHS